MAFRSSVKIGMGTMSDKVFVTGGSGFVGRNLIPALVAEGYQVKALARSASAAEIVKKAGAEVVNGDLDNPQALREGVAGCEVVFHSAAKVDQWGDSAEFHRINVTGTENLLKAAQEAGVKRFVHVSTEAVLVGENKIINADETMPRAQKPAGLYPLTKGLAEARVLAANRPDFETVIMRPRLIWGAGDTTVLPPLVEAVKDGRFMWFSGGHSLTSTCHVKNVCEGLILGAEKGRGGEIYFLTDGDPLEFREFVTKLLATQGLTPSNRSVPVPVIYGVAAIIEGIWRLFRLKSQPMITRMTIKIVGEEVTVNDAKARRELGYVGRVSREEGFRELAQSTPS